MCLRFYVPCFLAIKRGVLSLFDDMQHYRNGRYNNNYLFKKKEKREKARGDPSSPTPCHFCFLAYCYASMQDDNDCLHVLCRGRRVRGVRG